MTDQHAVLGDGPTDEIVQPDNSILIYNDERGSPVVAVSGRYVDDKDETVLTLEYCLRKIQLAYHRHQRRKGGD